MYTPQFERLAAALEAAKKAGNQNLINSLNAAIKAAQKH